jgi:O-antigen/teichoic acid export membrane protein
MSLIRQAFKGSLAVAAGNYLTYGFTILAQLWLVRLLAPEIYGAYAIILVIVEITYVLVMIEFGTACLYDMDNEQIFNTAVVMAWIWSIAILLFLLITYPVAKYWVDERTWAVVIILISVKCLYGVSAVYGTVLERNLQFGKLTYLRTFSRVVGLSIGLVMANKGFEINALLAIDLVYYLIAAFLIIYISPLKVSIREFDRQLAKKLIKNSFSQFHFRLSGTVLYRSPVILVQLLTGDKVLVGFMDRAIYLAQIVNTLTSAFTSKIAFILFKRLQSTPGYLERKIQLMIWFMTRLLVPVLAVFILLPKWIITLIYGEKWIIAAPLLAGLAVFSVVVTIYNILNQYFMSVEKLGVVTRLQWVMFAVMVITTVLIQLLELHYSYLTWVWSLLFLLATIYLTFTKHAIRFLFRHGVDVILVISIVTFSCLVINYAVEFAVEKIAIALLSILLLMCNEYYLHSGVWRGLVNRIPRIGF